jgi:DNA polymerase I
MIFRLPKHEKGDCPLVVLLDGMALAYRAYFAFIARPLVNSKGENTSAVFGFMSAFQQVLEHHDPTYAAVCFDTAAPTFRHERYDQYKANRQDMPPDLLPQIAKIKELCRAFRIPVIEMDGFEADDVIGTLAKLGEREACEALLVTPDKDFCQLVTAKVKLLRPGKEGREMEIYDEEAVRIKYGIEPIQIIDYLALVGDASDNIPGVRGIGEKTAIPLIQKFGSVEGLYERIDEVDKKGLKDKLVNDREKAFLSKELATIETNVPVNIKLEDLRYGHKPDYDQLEAMLRDLGFKQMLAKVQSLRGIASTDQTDPGAPATAADTLTLNAKSSPYDLDEDLQFEFKSEEQPTQEQTTGDVRTIKDTPHVYVMVRTDEQLSEMVKDLSTAKELCVDLETTSIDANQAEIIGISFSAEPGTAFYVPVRINMTDEAATDLFAAKPIEATENAFNTGLELQTVLRILQPLLENESIPKIGQNIKYDALCLRHHGVELKPLAFDTMVGAYVVRAEGSHSMDTLAVEYLKYRPVALNEVVGTLKPNTARETMGLAPTDKLAEYGAEDADITLQLKHSIEKELDKLELRKLCEEIDFPMVDVLTKVEFNGVKIDTVMLAEASKVMEKATAETLEELHKLAGGPFNPDSPKQLQEILFNRLGLKAGKKTKTGYSTDASVLEDLASEHPIAEHLLNYRQYQKLRGTYIDALPHLVNPKTGLIHTSYNQAVVATGRLSSTDPNLQNIPIRTQMGREIRKAFVSRFPDGQIFSADYSQIELRIMAHVTKDAALTESFMNNEDIHSRTAAGVYGVPLDQVDREMRRKAKEVNYGIMYGIAAFGLARRLGITSREATEIITRYFQAFPTIRKYIDDTLTFAREKGYVETLWGRRRYMKNINANNSAVRGADERAAINMPIQGTAADMLKIAMISIQREFDKRKMKSLMIMQVHDELVFDVVPAELDDLTSIVTNLMQNAMPMSVPITVESGVGKTWYDAH